MTRIQLMPRWAAATAIVVGCLVLAGWVSDVEFLKRVRPGLVAMNPATAVAFMLAGLALYLLQVEESRLPSRRAAQAGAGIVAMIGLLKLCALLGGPDVHVDQWLFPTKLAEAGSALPNRMAPNTALNFLLLGCVLLLLGAKSRRGAYLCQLCTLAITLTASLAIIGYAFDSRSFYRVGPFIPMALHTALCFLALAAGILAARPNQGIMAIFTSRGMGGIVARRMLPAAILVPIVLGWLRLEGERTGLYELEFGVAFMVTTIIFVFVALIGWTAGVLESADAERRLADEALYKNHEFLQAVLENTAEGIVACDAEGQLTFFNRATREFHGLPQESLPADQWPEYYSLYLPDGSTPMRMEDVPLFRALGGEHIRDVEMVIAPRDGSTRLVTNNGEPLFDANGAKLGAVVVMHDITQSRQAQEELQRAKEEAERANLAKSEFLSRMSHELRTPLNAILGFGQLLEMRNQDPAPQQQDNIQQILKAGRHLLDLINEVLDIARIEAGHLSLSIEPVAVGRSVREALDVLRPLAAARQIHLAEVLEGCEEQQILADQQRFKQVLLNLLSNAVKYNSDGGSVSVSCDVQGESADSDTRYLRLSVHDTGPGLTPAEVARLFVPFERLGAAQTQIEGTGIGLSLCKRLVEAMNGRVGVESEAGRGSTFWLELPLVESSPGVDALTSGSSALTSTPPSAPVLDSACTILCIEDNLSNLELIKQVLSDLNEPIRFLSAMQGSLGLDIANSHHPDLILLDVNLPDIMGDVVLSRLKASPVTQEIPVIVLSADATPRQIDRLLDAGAAHYLTKPLDIELFFNILKETLKTTNLRKGVNA